MLLEHVLQKPRSWLIAHDTDQLCAKYTDAFLSLAALRRQGHPMAYLVGVKEFRGHLLKVSPDVLIPRPDTELLVDIAINVVDQMQAESMLDLGTGSGAIAISVALARPSLRVTATDISLAALTLAQHNAQSLGARVQWWQGSWYEALPSEGRFDLIVSNPPYIAAKDEHLGQGDLRFEPRCALTDEADGLSALRRIVDEAKNWLNPDGQIWLEHGFDQAQEVSHLLANAGYKGLKTHQDLSGNPRVTGGYL
jgi:release factor glutamine methyltransferase